MECPSQEVLEKLCRGEIDSTSEQSLVEHIDQCDICQAAMDALSGSLTVSVQALMETDPSQDSQLLDSRLAQLKFQRPSPRLSGAGKFEDLHPWIESGDTDIGRVAHYDLIRRLGRGGMGIVFEAFDRELHRQVAVKMMSPALLVDPDNSRRFQREARAAAAIASRVAAFRSVRDGLTSTSSPQVLPCARPRS